MDKGLISRVHKELQILHTKRTIQLINGQMNSSLINKYMKKCSTSSIIKEMQIKTTLRLYLTPVE
jgi:hypothetical protein